MQERDAKIGSRYSEPLRQYTPSYWGCTAERVQIPGGGDKLSRSYLPLSIPDLRQRHETFQMFQNGRKRTAHP